MKKIFATFIIITLAYTGFSQNIAITDDNAYSPNNSSVLDVKSTSKGMLIPRLTSIQRTGITTPALGLIVFDTNDSCFYYFNGLSWINLSAGNSNNIWGLSNNKVVVKDTSYNIGIGTKNPNYKLVVQGDGKLSSGDTLFVVNNKQGEPVFIVTKDGAQVIVDETTKKNLGGFAVSGRTTGKGISNYLIISPDSARIYIKDSGAKKNLGGFAVSGRTTGKTTNSSDYLRVTSDSTRIFTIDTIKGFGVQSNGTSGKASYLQLSQKNYFIGHDAGKKNKTGLFNSFLGYNAGANNVFGWNNIFIGYKTGFSNIQGGYNTFLGHEAGYYNFGDTITYQMWGSYNSYIGYQAGYSGVRANNCVMLGYRAGYNNLEMANTFIGSNTGFNNNTGTTNTFLGTSAGFHNTTGSNNTFIGQASNAENETGSGNICIGNGAGSVNTSGNNNIEIGNGCSSGDGALYINGSGQNNIVIGNYAAVNNRGSGNVIIGHQAAGRFVTDFNDKFFVENSYDDTLPMISGDFAENRIAFHRIATTYPLQVGTNSTNGNGAFLTGGGIWTDISSKSLKDRFIDINKSDLLSKIENLDIKGWYYKGTEEYHIGPFAEDFYNAFGTGILNNKANLGKSIAASDVAGVSLIAVQEIIKQNKELKDNFNKLKEENTDLKTRIEKLEKLIEKK